MLKLQDGFHFDNSFKRLPKFLFEEVFATPIRGEKLIHVSCLKNEIGLNHLSDKELTSWLNGRTCFAGEQRISTRYAGHQFGVWAGQLGDGRAISLGEILSPAKVRSEIQTKGSGLTPFSRMGDGKAVIRSSVREYLCSEAMAGLNIPTTRALALLTGIDEVYRETVEHSALVVRVFPSNLRFGHFEMCYHFEQKEALKELIDYARTTFFDGLSTEEMLEEIIFRTAKLMALWQSVGFCHGVMNTDNMSLLGLTIDYGPYGFMEDTVLGFICNHTDQRGRYAYNQQPNVGMWNLERLLVCFLDEVPKDKLESLLTLYPNFFETEYAKVCRAKLGLKTENQNDLALFTDLLKKMSLLNLDFTFFFRQLSSYQKNKIESLKAVWDYYGNRQEIIDWLKLYDERLKLESLSDEMRNQAMKQSNPKYVLKNHIAQEVIEDVEEGRDEKLKKWLEVFYRPFDEHPQFEKYSDPTPSELKHFEVSCSS